MKGLHQYHSRGGKAGRDGWSVCVEEFLWDKSKRLEDALGVVPGLGTRLRVLVVGWLDTDSIALVKESLRV